VRQIRPLFSTDIQDGVPYVYMLQHPQKTSHSLISFLRDGFTVREAGFVRHQLAVLKANNGIAHLWLCAPIGVLSIFRILFYNIFQQKAPVT